MRQELFTLHEDVKENTEVTKEIRDMMTWARISKQILTALVAAGLAVLALWNGFKGH